MRKHNLETKPSDFDIISNDFENLFGSFEKCLEAAVDSRKSKMDVTVGLFSIVRETLKLGIHGTTCIVRNVPKAVTTIASVKREVIEGITDEYQQHQKQVKLDALDEKMAQLSRSKHAK
jgi:hypothetical protein